MLKMNKTVLIIAFSLILIGCNESKSTENHTLKINKLGKEIDSLKTILLKNNNIMKKQIVTSLTFQDYNAEKGMDFYVALFENSKIIEIERWGKGAPVKEGKIMKALFELDGNLFMCSDSPPNHHEWDFTPAVSNYIECDNEEEINKFFTKLSENGEVLMPLGNYGFSEKFAMVTDQFGVSWQLNLN